VADDSFDLMETNHDRLFDVTPGGPTEDKIKKASEPAKKLAASIAGLIMGGAMGASFGAIAGNQARNALGRLLGTASFHNELAKIAAAAMNNPLAAVAAIATLKQGNFRAVLDAAATATAIGVVGTIANGALATIIQNVPAAANLPIVLHTGRELLIQNNKLIEKISSGAGGDFILREIPNSEAEDLVLRFIDSSSVTEVQNEFGDTVLQVLPIGLNELRDFPVSEDDDRIIDDDGVEFKSSGATIIDLAVKEAIKKQKENPDVPFEVHSNFRITDSKGNQIPIPDVRIPETITTDAATAAAEKLTRQATQAAGGGAGGSGGGSAGIGGAIAGGLALANLASSNVSLALQLSLVGSSGKSGKAKPYAKAAITPEEPPGYGGGVE